MNAPLTGMMAATQALSKNGEAKEGYIERVPGTASRIGTGIHK